MRFIVLNSSLFLAAPARGEHPAEVPEGDATALLGRDELLAVLRGRRRHRVRPHQHHDLGQRVVVVVRSEEASEGHSHVTSAIFLDI